MVDNPPVNRQAGFQTRSQEQVFNALLKLWDERPGREIDPTSPITVNFRDISLDLGFGVQHAASAKVKGWLLDHGFIRDHGRQGPRGNRITVHPPPGYIAKGV